MSSGVVITGVGAITALGVGARVLHDRWAAGECGIEDGAGRCSSFEPGDFLSKKELRRHDRFSQLAVVAAQEAIEQAGLIEEDGPYNRDRMGCIIGTGIGGIDTLTRNEDVLRQEGPQKVAPLSIPLMMSNAAPAAVSMRFGLRGQCFGVVSACAAGSNAIGVAKALLEAGTCDVVVTGGAEAALVDLSFAAFSAMDALSNVGISRPFDAERDGFVMGEGAGVLVLEREDGARARGAEILGHLLGYASTADAHHLTAPHAEGLVAARAMTEALDDAGLSASDIHYVNAHGTSTPLNDRAETAAIKVALGQRAYEVPVTSTKSAIGHLLGAAGAVESIATMYAVRERVVPPTLGLENPEEGLDLDYVPHRAKPMETGGAPGVAMSNVFGFGGHNAVLVIGAPA